MKDFVAQKLKTAVKQQLRLKKATYKDLAEHINCSVPTIKRVLGEEELTLNRLLQILDFLDLTLGELEMLANQGEEKRPSFTPEQESFLVKNQNFLSYLLQLHNGKTPKKIAEEYQLNQRSTDKYLIGLERAGLIRVTGRMQVKPVYKQLPGLGRGPLGRAYLESVIQSAADFFIRMAQDLMFSLTKEPGLTDPPAPRKFFSMQTLKVTPESYKRYVSEQLKAEEEFIKLATYEEKTHPEGDLKAAVTLQAATLVELDYKPLRDLENIFGKITSI